MLSNIHIENIAVIKNIDIELSAGFCALTGETGAGKTVIMDAIRLIAGAKCDRDLIRRGEERAEVSALFSEVPEQTVAMLCDMGYECEDSEIMVRRSITADGKSSVKINGKSATAQMQRSIVGALLDIHGQHDNVSLLDKKTHLRMLDEYAQSEAELEAYKKCYSSYTEAKKKLAQFEKDTSDKQRQLEFLLMQIKEIEKVKPKEGEEEKLEAERLRLSSIEKVRRQANFAYRAIYGGEKGNACMLIDKSITAISSVADAVPELSALTERLREVYYELGDISQTLEGYTDNGEDPAARLDKIETRLDAIYKLKKKYGADIGEILAFYEKAKKKAEMYENSELLAEELSRECKRLSEELACAGDALSKKRREAASTLSDSVADALAYLDMPKVRFGVEIDSSTDMSDMTRYTTDGADRVAFMLSLSELEPMLELTNASGGELARVMLAIKSVMSQRFGAQTVIYDEIDAGVSGRTARKIGYKLKQSALGSQVICVTHSAQIASLADTHYKIAKTSVDGRFESGIEVLDRNGRIDELSRILGSINVTESQRQAAEDMLTGDDGEL